MEPTRQIYYDAYVNLIRATGGDINGCFTKEANDARSALTAIRTKYMTTLFTELKRVKEDAAPQAENKKRKRIVTTDDVEGDTLNKENKKGKRENKSKWDTSTVTTITTDTATIHKSFDTFMSKYDPKDTEGALGRYKGWTLMYQEEAKYINDGQIEYSDAENYFKSKGFYLMRWESLSYDMDDRGEFAVKPHE